MTKQQMIGQFISLEGVEGAGKSTALQCISDYFKSHNIQFIVTREPGGTDIAEQIRKILISDHDEKVEIDTEILLMFAARTQHVRQKILPAIKKGLWVISDRFTDATYAYQGGGRQAGVERVEQIDQWSLQQFKPDLTLLLDLPVEVGRQRIKTRKHIDRFEKEEVAFFERVRNAYKQRAQKNPERFKIIDASQSQQHVEKQIKKVLANHIEQVSSEKLEEEQT